MSNLKTISFLSSLLLLASCGGGSTPAQLEISSAFQTVADAGLTGGLVVYAESSTGKKISIALDASTEAKVTLDNEKWSFYAIGWDGSTKMNGNVKCASVISQDIKSNPKVTLQLAAATCALPDFTTSINVRSLKTLSCGTFNEYNSGTDTFSAITASTPDTYCSSLPASLQSDQNFYRVIIMNGQNGSYSPGLSSECYSTAGGGTAKIPLLKFPTVLQTYKTAADCTNKINPVTFTMNEGISKGNPSYFDHHLMDITGGYSRLILPSGVSRRGNSPFMNLIPRIMCAGTDCLSDLSLSAHVSVPWTNSSNNDQPLLKGLPSSVNTCPADFLSGSSNFMLKNCSVREGTVVGTLNRNQLVCQGINPGFNDLTDIYVQGDKIYIFSNVTGYIKIYSTSGEFIQQVMTSYSATAMAVAPNGTIFLVQGYDLYIANSGDNYSTWSSAYLSGNLVKDFVVSDSNQLITLDDSGNIRTYAFGSYGTPTSTLSSTQAKQIYYHNSKIYAVKNNRVSPDNSVDQKIYQASVATNGTVSPLTVALPFDLPGYPTSIAVEGDHAYIAYSDGTTSTSLDAYSLSTNTQKGDLGSGISHGTVNMVASKGNVYIQNAAAAGIQSLHHKPSVSQVIFSTLSASNDCSEAVTVSLGGASKTLSIKSAMDSAFPVFDAAVDVLGRRSFTNFDQAQYLFRSINRNDDGYSEGGQLRRVQELLSSASVSGLIGNIPSCSAVVSTIAASGPITKNQLIVDPHDGSIVNVSLVTSLSTMNIPTHFCSSDDPNYSGCTNQYDLELNYRVLAAGRVEKGKFLLDCDQKAGQFESLEAESTTKTNRELYHWTTQASDYSRFEKYSFEISPERRSAEVLTVAKTGSANSLASRSLRFEISSSNNVWANISEFEMDATNMFSKNFHLSDTSFSNFFSNTTYISQYAQSFDNIRGGLSFTALTSDNCVASGTTDVFTVSTPGCSFTHNWTTTSKGMNLNVNAFSDFESVNPGIKSYFSLIKD